MRRSRLFLLVLLNWSAPVLGADWSFSAVQNGQCGPLTVTWSNGKPPYTISIHPLNGTGRKVSVPDDNVKNGQGSMEVTLQVPQGKQFVVTMGDANGLLTGGASQLLTAGAQSQGIQNCNTTYPNPDFFWTGPSTINQCKVYPFTEIATQKPATFQGPATALVIVPDSGNSSFSIQMDAASSFSWTANVAQGTKVILDVVDSQGHQGGVIEQVLTVGAGDNSCTLHNANDNSSTSGSNANPNGKPAGNNTSLGKGAIAGIAVGCVVGVALVVVLLFLLFRRRRHRDRISEKPVDLLGTSPTNYTVDEPLPPGAVPQPFYDESSNRMSHMSASTAASPNRNSKGAGHNAHHPPAIIQHSDIEEGGSPVELPPQYSDTRRPLLDVNGQWGGGSVAGSSMGATGSSGVTSPLSSQAHEDGSQNESQRSNSMRKGPR